MTPEPFWMATAVSEAIFISSPPEAVKPLKKAPEEPCHSVRFAVCDPAARATKGTTVLLLAGMYQLTPEIEAALTAWAPPESIESLVAPVVE